MKRKIQIEFEIDLDDYFGLKRQTNVAALRLVKAILRKEADWPPSEITIKLLDQGTCISKEIGVRL